MNLKTIIFAAIISLATSVGNGQQRSSVDTFIGVDKGGNVLPGPCMPFGIVRLNPLMVKPHTTSGYKSGSPIMGFAQTNVSGTGGAGRYGNLCVLPRSGNLDTNNRSTTISDETSSLSYYSARCDKGDILAELTATQKCGVMRFTFPSQEQKHILLDISSVIDLQTGRANDGKCLMAYGLLNEDNIVEGFAHFQGGWGHMKPYTIYFAARSDTPFSGYGTFSGDKTIDRQRVVHTTDGGFYFTYDKNVSTPITFKVAISTLSTAKAKENLSREGWLTFDQVLAASRQTWEKELSKIEVEGGTDDQQTLFYTSLYRSLVMPTDVSGENPNWDNTKPHYWDYYCIWDTFRTVFPLFSLISPQRYAALVNSLLDTYTQVGWMPDAWVVGGIARQQGGTNCDVIISEAMSKGIKGIDYNLAYRAAKKNASTPADETWDNGRGIMVGKHKSYIDNGYVPAERYACVSYTMEYAYNDFCFSVIADKMGKKEEAEFYRTRSLNVYNLFNQQTGFFWAKDQHGVWAADFSPTFFDNVNNRDKYFYEGTPWQYFTYVPHDVAGLMKRCGGRQGFEKRLDDFFNNGYYTQSNEPDIHAPYLYNYVGRNDKCSDVVRDILKKTYSNTRAGLPGNDDSGCMSSWYIFSSLGIYPAAGQAFYFIGTPLFPKAVINLENGSTFTINAPLTSDKNRYIQRATLNGKELTRSWIDHSEIVNGGVLTFEMDDKPSSWAAASPMPKSASEY